MPGDIAIHAASPTSGASPAAQTPAEPGSAAAIQARASVAASTVSAATTSAQPTAAAASAGDSSPSLHTNPVSHLDPALGIVVLGFYNEKGVETSSIPTQKQLESYRLHGETSDASHTRIQTPPGA